LDGDIGLVFECIVFSQGYDPTLVPLNGGGVIRIDDDNTVINDGR
jgi:hypothetical protein